MEKIDNEKRIKLTKNEKDCISNFGAYGVMIVSLGRVGKTITKPNEICPIIDCRHRRPNEI